MVKIKVSLSIGFAGCTQRDILEIPQEEWDACKNEQENWKLMNDYWVDWSNNYIDGGCEIL